MDLIYVKTIDGQWYLDIKKSIDINHSRMKMNDRTMKQTFTTTSSTQDATQGNGLILIADISGFTKFVRETDVIEGSKITRILLSSIMDSNILHLEVSEIEGDAIFFYKYGELPSVCSIIKQYELMLDNFNAKLRKIKVHYKKRLELSLKVIVHVGTMTEYNIGNFKKLYGESVIEAHRLLKNPIRSKSYVLLTDDLIKTTLNHYTNDHCVNPNAVMLSESYGTDTTLQFTYYDYEAPTINNPKLEHTCSNTQFS